MPRSVLVAAASAEAKRLLGVPDERLLRETISLGYPADHRQPTTNPPGRKRQSGQPSRPAG